MVAEIIDLDAQALSRAQHTYSTLVAAAIEEMQCGNVDDARAIDALAERIRISYEKRGIKLEG